MDRYDKAKAYYAASPKNDPTGPSSSGSYRVDRGGGWDDRARYCRSAYRNYYSPEYRLHYLGFRVSLVPAE